jgi:hypothetical protein
MFPLTKYPNEENKERGGGEASHEAIWIPPTKQSKRGDEICKYIYTNQESIPMLMKFSKISIL